MNIYRINLNLLKVFTILMREQHVSAAAECLHLTQPAISNSLQQLRELFQDELLIRGPKKMVPTQKALLLAPKIEQALRQLETSLFYTDEFDYQTSLRTFHLGMSDYSAYVLLPKIYEELAKVAPNLSLKILTYHEFSSEHFENDALDLGIGLDKNLPKPLIKERLFADRPVCVAHKDHAMFQSPLTLEHYLQLKHLTTCIYLEEGLSRADLALKKLGLEREIKLTLPNVLPAFQMLVTSNLVGTFSRNIVLLAEKQYPLKHIDPPFDIPKLHISQIWHRQQDNDSGLLWLRKLIKSVSVQHFSSIDS